MFHRFKYSVSVLLVLVSGCASSTIGPGSGVVTGTVNGTVEDVNKRAEEVFQKMSIQVTGNSTKNAGNERQLSGKIGDTDVQVTLDNASGTTTHIEVKASKNMINGKKDLARDILNQIVKSG